MDSTNWGDRGDIGQQKNDADLYEDEEESEEGKSANGKDGSKVDLGYRLGVTYWHLRVRCVYVD